MRRLLLHIRRAHRYCSIALGVCGLAVLFVSCASQRSLYVYRAYQEPSSTRGPYYLRDALVVAPDHASAMSIVAEAMTDIHPSWSGPLYISFVGVSEEQRKPGLLGGPVWLASTDSEAEMSGVPGTSGKSDLRESVSIGPPEG